MPPPANFDIIITHGHIIDGTGSPWYEGDIGIKDGRIAAIGNLSSAPRKQTVDAHGMVVAPGFIDMLGQSEYAILVDPRLPSKIFQGITTEITGEGDSVAPVNDAILRENEGNYAHFGITHDWHDHQTYFARLKKQGIGINVGDYVGAATVREMVLGYGDRAPSADELKRMQALVTEAMQQGALGLSDGTAIPARALCAYGGIDRTGTIGGAVRRDIRDSHAQRRGWRDGGARGDVPHRQKRPHIPIEIFHLKASGKANWGSAPRVIHAIEAARAQGIDVAADTYAYTAWQNSFSRIHSTLGA